MSRRTAILEWNKKIFNLFLNIDSSDSLHRALGAWRLCKLHVMKLGCLAWYSMCDPNWFSGLQIRNLLPSSHKRVVAISKIPESGRQSSSKTISARGSSIVKDTNLSPVQWKPQLARCWQAAASKEYSKWTSDPLNDSKLWKNISIRAVVRLCEDASNNSISLATPVETDGT